MNYELLHGIEKGLQEIIISHYANKSINIFDKFIQNCQNYYEGPAHSLAEIKLKQNTKLKGDIFEHFAYKYFQHVYKVKFTSLWLLKDTPNDVLEKLKLKRHDLGIDLLGVDSEDKYYAIQAKYRKKGYKATHGISWKQLSTFYALVNRTGPYERTIVITNTDFVRHIGRKTRQDQSICYGTLSKLPIESWIAMAHIMSESSGHSLQSVHDEVKPIVEPIPELKSSDNQDNSEPEKKKIIIKKLISSDSQQTDQSLPVKRITIKKTVHTPALDLDFVRKKRMEYFATKQPETIEN